MAPANGEGRVRYEEGDQQGGHGENTEDDEDEAQRRSPELCPQERSLGTLLPGHVELQATVDSQAGESDITGGQTEQDPTAEGFRPQEARQYEPSKSQQPIGGTSGRAV
jgi:hypothetical protein